MKKSSLFRLSSLFFLAVSLFLLLFFAKKIQNYLSRASWQPANIVIETQTILGPLPKPWQALAQGGEEKEKMLSSTIGLIKPLTPQYIRVDHLYDFYEVVSKNPDGKLFFNFSQLDSVVNDILATGAKPMLSLSYMPPAISSGDITDPPKNWLDWQETVRATIEHYSGINQRNLSDVYYEVWNEPDLFGQWKTYGNKDYRTLYDYSIRGAAAAQAVNSFKIGGPGTTAFYKNWLEEFIKYIYENNLRLDFFSWHRYSLSPRDFLDDLNFIDSLLSQHGGSYLLPKFITEWGSDSEINPIHDTNFDAAHTIATLRQILDRVDLAFTFEIKDGPDPSGRNFWGRWGILDHNSSPKPRYFALKLLNQISGERLKLQGEGTYVTGFSTKDGNKIQVLLVNYDKEGKHEESFPVNFTGLAPGNYQLTQTDLLGKTVTTTESVTQDSLIKTTYLPINSVILLELFP